MYGATVGESSVLSIEATCNQAICAILEKELSFVYVFLYLRIFKSDILNQATGSAQQNISQQIIKNISIVSPPVGLKVFKELEDYYNLIEQNVLENKSLKELRDILLPKLISGEVHVKDAEKTLSEIL
jgi:type I restriction enzyme S subunit